MPRGCGLNNYGPPLATAGGLVFHFGFAVILMNVWILALTPICAWVLQRLAILPEEAYLERKFGGAYMAYKSRVRRWL